jgi:hypothetical protein
MIHILLETGFYIPPLAEITLRTDRTDPGWQDVTGRYAAGTWQFDLPAEFAGPIRFKFVLDRTHWMEGQDLAVEAEDGRTYRIGTEGIRFVPATPTGPVREYGQIQRRYFEPPAADTDEPFDVIVIGSGMGGGVLADALSDLGRRVLVLEAGGFLFPTHIANLPRRQIIERERMVKHIWALWEDFRAVPYENINDPQHGLSEYEGGYGFYLGGRSVFWGAFIPRMTSWELDYWGRDVKWALEDTYYQRAEDVVGRSVQPRTLYARQVFQFLRNAEGLKDWHHVDAPVSARQSFVDANTISTGVFSTADLLMESALSPRREGSLRINLNHPVEEVAEGADGVEVRARDLKTGQTRTYRAQYAVLCAGTIESARIAQRSSLKPEGLIGKGLTDHPVYFAHFKLPRTSAYFNFYVASRRVSFGFNSDVSRLGAASEKGHEAQGGKGRSFQE